MGKFRTTAVAAAIALGSVGLLAPVAPAHADPTTDTCVIVGQAANVSSPSSPGGGLYYPVTDPAVASHPTTGPDFTWELNGVCNNNGASFTSSGTAYGWCGRSVGDGAGIVNGRNYIVHWESFGSQLILTDPSARGSVNAQANPPGSPNGSCLSGTAKTFLVDGAITVVGV